MFLFSTNGKTPISGFSKLKRKLDANIEAHLDDWRFHDLRRTAVTGMIELGVQPHIVEAAINHVSGSRAGVAGVYNKAKLREPVRAALELWAEHVLQLAASGSAHS